MPGITPLPILAVATATVVCVAACGSDNQHAGTPTSSAHPTSSASPSPSPPAPHPGTDHVEGMITSFSGNTISLRLRQGTATVDFAPSTEIVETTPAQFSDVTPNSCVDVRPAPQSAPGAVTAQSVTISPVIDGNCPPPPGPAGTAPSVPSSSAPGVNGKVDSVSGNTITVVGAGPSGPATQTKVTVTDTTSYSKETPTDTEALTSGKCMSAVGTKDNNGVLQATTIDLQPCPPMGRPHRRFPHIPLPHHHH